MGDPSVTHLAVSTQGLAAVAPPYPSQRGSAAGRIRLSLLGMPSPGAVSPAQLLRDGPKLKNNPGPAATGHRHGRVLGASRWLFHGRFTATDSLQPPGRAELCVRLARLCPTLIKPQTSPESRNRWVFPEWWDRLEPRTPLLWGHHIGGGRWSWERGPQRCQPDVSALAAPQDKLLPNREQRGTCQEVYTQLGTGFSLCDSRAPL